MMVCMSLLTALLCGSIRQSGKLELEEYNMEEVFDLLEQRGGV